MALAFHGAQVVLPEQPPERTVVDSVRNFLQTSGGYAQVDSHDKVTCVSVQHVRFSVDQPLVTAVFVGYSNGYQIWALAGESSSAHELVSVRNATHTHLIRLLESPDVSRPLAVDRFATKRPLVAVCCDEASVERRDLPKRAAARTNGVVGVVPQPAAPRCVQIISLRTGEMLEQLALANTEPHMVVENVLANERWVVVVQSCCNSPSTNGTSAVAPSSPNCYVSVHDAGTLQQLLQVRVGACASAVTLGIRWLAFGERRIRQALASCGGVALGPAAGSYVTAALGVTKTLYKGITMLSESVASWTGAPHSAVVNGGGGQTMAANADNGDAQCSNRLGVVTVLDLAKLSAVIRSYQNGSSGHTPLVVDTVSHLSPNSATNALLTASTVAHFVAHVDETVQRVAFDASGALVLTAGASGRCFNVFSLHVALSVSQRSAVHHLYTLRRGHTDCVLQDVSFAADSRFVAATSQRGTVHLFAIAPYGGTPTVRTHATPRVVNRTSKFQRSAGLDELPPPASAAAPAAFFASPSPTQPCGPSLGEELTPLARVTSLMNPRKPPFPLPVELHALTQVRHALAPFALNLNDAQQPVANVDAQSELIGVSFGAPANDYTAFGYPFHAVCVSPTSATTPCCVDVLLVVNGSSGTLTQYDVSVDAVSRDRSGAASNDAAIAVTLAPRSVWQLRRNATAATSSSVVSTLPLFGGALLNSNAVSSLASASGKKLSNTTFPSDDAEWMAQVEIVTYNGPHRRLWMGPHFTFCTNTQDASSTDNTVAQPRLQMNFHQPLDNLMPLASNSSSVLQTLGERELLVGNSATTRSSPIAICGGERRQRNSSNVLIEACSLGSAGSMPTASLTAAGYESVGASCEQDEAMRRSGMLDDSRIRKTIEDALMETPQDDLSCPDNGRNLALRPCNCNDSSPPTSDPLAIGQLDLNADAVAVATSPVVAFVPESEKTSSSSEPEQVAWPAAVPSARKANTNVNVNSNGNGNATVNGSSNGNNANSNSSGNGGRANRRNGKQKRGAQSSVGVAAQGNMSP